VAFVALRTDGRPLGGYFAVEPNPRGRVDVRLTNRITLLGPKGVFTLEPGADAAGRWTLVEELHGTRLALPLPDDGEWSFAGALAPDAWFSAPSHGHQRCDLFGRSCAADAAGPPTPTLRRQGPGEGFRLATVNGTLRFWPPHLPEGADGEAILGDVSRLLAVRWLDVLPTAAVREYLDRSFRGAARLEAEAAPTTLDGDLDDWRATEPEVVDSPWQAAVRRNWHGPADASFSIAARFDGDTLCFAGRLRDDDLREGDQLTLHFGAERWVLPLQPGAGTEGLVVAREPFGFHFEACRRAPPHDRSTPFAALLEDRDGDDDADILSTAPIFDGQPAGALLFPP
jgi:hypothetical protein